jgi:hypothetical protein
MLKLIACHFIGDFPFQPEFLALGKGKSWELNLYHTLVYTATFILFGDVSLLIAGIIFITHFVIDPLKARWKIIPYLWIDQLLHIGVLIGCFWLTNRCT